MDLKETGRQTDRQDRFAPVFHHCHEKWVKCLFADFKT